MRVLRWRGRHCISGGRVDQTGDGGGCACTVGYLGRGARGTEVAGAVWSARDHGLAHRVVITPDRIENRPGRCWGNGRLRSRRRVVVEDAHHGSGDRFTFGSDLGGGWERMRRGRPGNDRAGGSVLRIGVGAIDVHGVGSVVGRICGCLSFPRDGRGIGISWFSRPALFGRIGVGGTPIGRHSGFNGTTGLPAGFLAGKASSG